MNTGEQIEIPLNKTKIVIMLLGALAFVAGGFWFVVAPPEIKNPYWGNPTRLAVLGGASIFFFGLCAAFFIRKLPDNRPGLIINNTGLTDNAGALSAGLILWTDIGHISVLEMHKQKLLMLKVSNPEEYIARQKNVLKRKGMEMNYKMYGTPISISANDLKIPFDELLSLVMQKYQEANNSTVLQPAAIQVEV